MGVAVRARITTDDRQVSATFNADPWFAQASDDDIRELHAKGYRCCEEADAIAYHVGEGNPAVGRVFRYLKAFRPKTQAGGLVGFEVELSKPEVRRYLSRARPHLVRQLFDPIPDRLSEEDGESTPEECDPCSTPSAATPEPTTPASWPPGPPATT